MTTDDVTGLAEPSKVRVMESKENEDTKERVVLVTIQSSNSQASFLGLSIKVFISILGGKVIQG